MKIELNRLLPIKTLLTVRNHLALRGYPTLFDQINLGSYECFTFPINICEICYEISVKEIQLIEADFK